MATVTCRGRRVTRKRRPPTSAQDHLSLLVLHADRDPAERELAPLEARAKLLETLRVWLDDQGRVERTARHLGAHPQTVRYRVDQLRERFGRRLEDPEGRHALALRSVPRRASATRGGVAQQSFCPYVLP